jgi:hypothetical protein
VNLSPQRGDQPSGQGSASEKEPRIRRTKRFQPAVRALSFESRFNAYGARLTGDSRDEVFKRRGFIEGLDELDPGSVDEKLKMSDFAASRPLASWEQYGNHVVRVVSDTRVDSDLDLFFLPGPFAIGPDKDDTCPTFHQCFAKLRLKGPAREEFSLLVIHTQIAATETIRQFRNDRSVGGIVRQEGVEFFWFATGHGGNSICGAVSRVSYQVY